MDLGKSEKKPQVEGHAFRFTLNNYTEEEILHIKEIDCRYLIFGKEVGESGTPHLQGYLYFEHSVRFTAVKKKLGKRANYDFAKGTGLENKHYCSKGEQSHTEWEDLGIKGPNYGKNADVFERGWMPNQGQRKDLDDLKDKILKGETNCDDIACDIPAYYHEYGRTLHKIEDIRMRNVFRKEMTKGIWYYGTTGTGKSAKAFENFNPNTHYVWNMANNWNDGYKQQETVIIDEFRGHMPFNELLRMVDIHPNYYVERRGRERLPFTSKKVIITSSLRPEEVFKNLQDNDKWEQFYRRFEIIELTNNN